MTEPLRVGIIGCGRVSQIAHLPAFVRPPDVRVMAVVDGCPNLAADIAERYDVPNAFDSHQTLLSRTSVDAVVIVLPRPSIGPVAKDCLEAGCHVLTEKPMCGTLAQARKLVATAEAADRRYVVGYMKRFDTGVERAKSLMDEILMDGTLGGVRLVRMHCYQGDDEIGRHKVVPCASDLPDGPEWPMAPEWLDEEWHVPYHVYLNRYVHDLNLLRHLLPGELELVQFRFTELFSQLAVLDLDGVTVTLETGFNHFQGWDEVLEVYFERGRLTLRLPPPFKPFTPARVELIRSSEDGQIIDARGEEPSWAFFRQAEAFVSTVRDGRGSRAEAADALTDMALIEDMWRRVERTRP